MNISSLPFRPPLRRAGLALAILATVGLAGLVSSPAAANPIEERQQAMKNIGEHLGLFARIARDQAPFDAAAVQAAGTDIAANFRKAFMLFPEESANGPPETWARPEIWANLADFRSKGEAGIAAAEAMAAVTDADGFRTALGPLGNTCRDCHQSYRRPKN